MIQSNRVTIIVDDKAVYLDQYVYDDLDFSNCGISEDIHALQWMIDKGHIEYRDARHNLDITELPEWAIKCVEQWEIAYNTNPPTEQHA
jgi:hypothetical protein